MKRFFGRFTKKQIVFGLLSLISLLVFVILTILTEHMKGSLLDQQMASRWSDKGDTAQISCYFTKGNEIDSSKIMEFRYQVDKVLQEASLVPEHENAILYTDAYSSFGKLTIQSEKASLDSNAIGIGGDFFLFHPLQLVSGSYFSEHDIMNDYVIIDEVMAWQLYGSNDIAGMSVMINGIPHIITGVYKKEEGRLWEAAGLSDNVAFVSEESLAAYGTTDGILHYEIVMPNPVKGFAYDRIKENFGFDEHKMYVIDNTRRYTLEPMITVIADYGTRSMQNQALQFPYWENYARGYEDIVASILVVQILFLLIFVVIAAIGAIAAWRRRTWTMKTVGHAILNQVENVRQKVSDEKGKWKHF